MANPEHVKIVKQGAEAIVRWRKTNPVGYLDLGGANLRRVDFTSADLQCANLSGANLNGVIFEYANFRSAYLNKAFLEGTRFKGANLEDTHLYGAFLEGVESIVIAIGDGWEFYGIENDDGLRIQAGCRWFTVKQAAKHTKWIGDDEHARLSRAAVEALVVQAKARGWVIQGDES